MSVSGWKGEVHTRWKTIRLKHLATMKSGMGIVATDILEDGIYPVYGGNGRRGFSNAFTHRGEHLLVGRQGALCGNVHRVSGLFWASEHAVVTTPAPNIQGGWLFYTLQHMNLNQYSVSAAQPGLAVDRIRELLLPVPPLPIQKAIADFLDRKTAAIDALIEKKQKLLELLAEKRAALINQAVTKGLDPTVPMKDSGIPWIGEVPAHWTVRSIKRDTRVRRGASPRPIDDPIYFDDDGIFAWVRIADVSSSNGVLLDTSQRLSALGATKSVQLRPGDLFLSIAGSVGKPCISGINCCIHDGFVYFPDLTMEPWYLYYVFLAGEAYKGLGKLGTQLNLNTDTVGWIQVPIPPQKEQRVLIDQLGKQLHQHDSIVDLQTLQIERLQEYRQALITAAVTGQLEIPEPEAS